MKKILILTITALALLSMSAFATETRVLTMGDNNMIIVDDANTGLFPGRILNYPDLAIGEFNPSNEFHRFGINWKFGDTNPWVLGTEFSTMPPIQPRGFDVLGGSGPSLVSLPSISGLGNRRFDLTYGRELSGKNFGFKFGYINSSSSSDVSADESEENFSQYLFGFGLTSPQGDWDLGVHIGLGSWTDKDVAGLDESEANNYYDFLVVGRWFHTMNPRVTLVPHGELQLGKHGAKIAGADTTESKITNLGGGLGLNYTPSRGVFAVADFGFSWTRVDNDAILAADTKETDLILPFWKLGLDAEVFKWLDLRMGVTSNWSNFKEEDVIKENHAENQTYLGTGLHFGRLHIDTYTDPQIVLDGFNFVSGSTDADDLNFQVSVLYEMF